MKLLFIRHGDPDYEKDSLTEKDGTRQNCWDSAWRTRRSLRSTSLPWDVPRIQHPRHCKKWAEMPQNWRGCGNFTHPFRIFTPANQELPGISSRQTGPQSRSITTRHAGRKPCPCCRSRDRRGKACLERSGRDPDTARL